jgi:hypothetical protein
MAVSRTGSSTVDGFIDRLRRTADRISTLHARVQAGAPWPLAERFGTEPEAEWGPMEVLAHCAEMLPFWLGEIERIEVGEPEPVPFGRVAGDQLRIGIIERDRTLPARELFDRIVVGADRHVRRLPDLGDSGLGRRGLHPRRGEMTVAEVLEDFVVGHLEEHEEQLVTAIKTGR